MFSCASASSLRYRDGARTAAAVAATVWFFGASFGLVGRSAGMGVLAPFVRSATTFAGSAQFAAASILAGSGSAVAAITAAVLLNARYVPISISLVQLLHGPRPRRLVESQLIVDESWALADRGGRFDRRILIGAGLLLYAAWASGTTVGVVARGAFGDPKDLGLDGAFPALFLALPISQLRSRRALVATAPGGDRRRRRHAARAGALLSGSRPPVGVHFQLRHGPTRRRESRRISAEVSLA